MRRYLKEQRRKELAEMERQRKISQVIVKLQACVRRFLAMRRYRKHVKKVQDARLTMQYAHEVATNCLTSIRDLQMKQIIEE
jgi:myosin heavy subunit